MGYDHLVGATGRRGCTASGGAGDKVVIMVRVDPHHRATAAYGRDVAVRLAGRVMSSLQEQLNPAAIAIHTDFEWAITMVWQESRTQLVDLLRRMPAVPLVTLDGRAYVIDALMGVAYSGDLPTADSPDELQAHADAALCDALRRQFTTSYAGPLTLGALRDEVDLVRRLRSSKGDDFFVVYQPLVGLDDLEVRGFESLLRWDAPEAIVTPEMFMSEAESSSLIVPISWHSIRESIAALATQISQRFGPTSFVSINLSRQQLLDAEIVEYIGDLIREYGVDPARIWVEIGEDQMIALDSSAAQAVVQLHAIGCRICVDDLGSGFSALSYIRDLPVDVLKIDRSLISNLVAGGHDRAVVQAICEMAMATGIVTVAEGIESADVLAEVKALGFDLGQGYLFGRPDLPLVVFDELA